MAVLVASQSSTCRDLPAPHAPASGPVNRSGQTHAPGRDPQSLGTGPEVGLHLEPGVVSSAVDSEVDCVAKQELHTQSRKRPTHPEPSSGKGNFYTSGRKGNTLAVVGVVLAMLLSLCPCPRTLPRRP